MSETEHLPELDATEAETFLGGLRSELDEGSHIHPSFAAMVAAADSVRASYLSFAITPARAAEAFKALRLVDDNDIEWTVGPSSGSWYRRRVGTNAWQPAPPPLMAEPKSGAAKPWADELSELLPSARATAGVDPSPSSGRAGIRVVAAEINPVDEGETRDWLLGEWDELEGHLQVMQEQVRSQQANQAELEAAAQAAQQAQQAYAAAAAAEAAAESEKLGLPETIGSVDNDPLDALSLFVPPEPRADSVTLDDLLERGPSPRPDDTPAASAGTSSNESVSDHHVEPAATEPQPAPSPGLGHSYLDEPSTDSYLVSEPAPAAQTDGYLVEDISHERSPEGGEGSSQRTREPSEDTPGEGR